MECKPSLYNSKDLDLRINCKPRPNKYSCIWVDKVFNHCYQKECIRNFKIDLHEDFFKNIEFRPGFILKNTIKIDNMKDENSYRRVRYTLRIPYVINTLDGEKIKGYIPDIYKDITFPMINAREDYNFDIRVETYSKVLNIYNKCNSILLDIGIVIVTKIVGKVQLAVKIPRPKPKFIRVDIPIRKVDDVIIYGKVKECEDTIPIEGALVGVFVHENSKKKKICHTFSGCDGYYMVRIPPQYEGKTVTIMAVKENCFKELEPCDCELIDINGNC